MAVPAKRIAKTMVAMKSFFSKPRFSWKPALPDWPKAPPSEPSFCCSKMAATKRADTKIWIQGNNGARKLM